MANSRKIYGKTIISFFLTLIIFSIIIFFTTRNKTNIEELQMERLILESSYRINESISKKLYKTQALAGIVIQGDGVVNNFQQIAAIIASDEPCFVNFLLAPDGIISDVYPIEENITIIGLNFFDETFAGNKEAILARDSGELVMAGPFFLLQGFWGLVGRYPVFIDTESEKNKFWGLVSVSLRFPEALEDTGISMLEHQGFSYDLWRINPDTGEQQIITSGNKHFTENVSYVERQVKILNADWYFRIFPMRSWYEHIETWLLIFFGLSLSVLLAFFVQNHIELKIIKNDLLFSNNILKNDAIIKESELAENKIAMMLSQIQPHFLFNVLTAIAALCKEDPDKAQKATMNFSMYLRSNMESLDKKLISFEKELNHVKGYLELEKAIYEELLNVDYNIEDVSFLLPPLTIQPIVENAIKHGIGKKEDGGTITISVIDTNFEYFISVTDDGAGFDTQTPYEDDRKHTGLENVKRRLKEQCSGTLEIISQIGKGTTALIKIPKQKNS